MLDNSQKYIFLNELFENIFSSEESRDFYKKIMFFLMKDTQNGKLYKYRAFNDYAISNLKENTLYCAEPSAFNDPFDSKVGVDLQSISKCGSDSAEMLEEYFNKFLWVYDGTLSSTSFDEPIRSVFEQWTNSRGICDYLKCIRDGESTQEEVVEIFLDNPEIMYDLVLPLVGSDRLRLPLEKSKDIVCQTVKELSKEEKQQIVNLENKSFVDYARAIGITEDADEVSLFKEFILRKVPGQYEEVVKMDSVMFDMDKRLSEQIDMKFRIGSLCTDFKNNLMWSHYADSHKGFCIEYDFSCWSAEQAKIFILPVFYSKERPKFPWELILANDTNDVNVKNRVAKKMLLSLLTKDEVWNYENEWRIITMPSNDVDNIIMPPISCIYIGALCSEENKQMLMKIASERNIPVKQMVVDRGEYKLHAQLCN